MAQFASDTFSGTDGTELSTYNSAWTKHPNFSGNLLITDAERVRRQNTTMSVYYHSGSPASADYTVSADLRAFDTDGGITYIGPVARMNTSATTWYQARYAGGSDDAWQLRKAVGGSYSSLGSTSQTFTNGDTRNVKLSVEGTTIEMFIDGSGTPLFSTTDSSITAAGKAGLLASGSVTNPPESNIRNMHLDNFSADDIGGGGPPTLTALSASLITATGARLTVTA